MEQPIWSWNAADNAVCYSTQSSNGKQESLWPRAIGSWRRGMEGDKGSVAYLAYQMGTNSARLQQAYDVEIRR